MRQDAKDNAPKRIPIQHILGPILKKTLDPFFLFFLFFIPLSEFLLIVLFHVCMHFIICENMINKL